MPRFVPPLLLLALVLAPTPVAAQPEIVPAEHPVYEFLHHQRVRGILPEYRHEWRPFGRDRIGALLDSVEARRHSHPQDRSSLHWLTVFQTEMHEPRGLLETVYEPGRGIRVPLGRDTRKFLFYHRDDDWRIALSGIGRLQVRLTDAARGEFGVAFVPEGILEGNYRGIIGFYTGTFNGLNFLGDSRVLTADPFLAPLYYVAIDDVPQGNFDRSTASVRVAGRTFSAEIGHARLIAGASFADPLILSENPGYFPYLRAGIDGRVVQYAIMHASLGDRARWIPGDEGEVFADATERYMAMHRLTLNPWHWLQLAFSEMVVYGRRGPELAYLNPVYPIKPAEHALWDRDNANFSLEAVVRPTRGLEAYGTVFIADLDVRLLGQNSYNNKWAIQGGAGGAIGPALGWIEYTRVEPFVYTHRFLVDGSFYNSYTHHEFGLGHPLGPNTDQWLAGVRGWLPGRLRGELQARYVRRGENYVDPDTGELVNVGGDIRDGRQPPFTQLTKEFLAGNRFEGPGVRAKLSWQPIQDFEFNLWADHQRWDGGEPNQTFVRAEFVVGF